MGGPRPEDKDSAARSRSSSSSPQVDVIVLTADSALLATLRDASGPAHNLLHAETPEAAVDLLVSGHCGIFVVDIAVVRHGVVELIDKLQAQFPEVLLLATGRRDEQHAVTSLVGSGRIYRFLHKPISPARAELFLSTAARRYGALHPHDGRSRLAIGSLASPRTRTYSLLAMIAIVSIGGAIWWSGSDRQEPAAVARDQATPARQALPAEDSQPRSPDDRRQTPLTPQAAPTQRSNVPRPATPSPSTRPTAAPRTLTPNVDRARAFLAENQLVDPPEASAFGSLRDARQAQEDESAIQITATDLGTRLLNRAIAALEANDVAAAQAAHAAASNVDRELEAALPELDLVAARIRDAESAAERAATAESVARAARLRESGQLIEPVGDNAIEALQAAMAADGSSPDVRLEQQRLSFALLESTRTALAAGDIDRADVLATRAEEVLPGLPQARALREQIGLERARREESIVLQAASLPRTREVPAVYPRDALLNSTQGWVDLEFTISAEGVPTEVRVKASSPLRTFDVAAVQALRQWRFQPIMRGGVPQARRALLRMEFKLKDE